MGQIICFGANDACLPDDPTDHHVPLNEFRSDLVSIITHAKVKAQSPRVLLITPPPVDEYQQIIADRARGFGSIRRIAQNTRLYAQACKEVGCQLNVPVVDIWTAFTHHAGLMGEQDYMPGTREFPINETLQSLFSDDGSVRI
jgi:lysophospholipase L1-like esterase